jgi:hypothetical protein
MKVGDLVELSPSRNQLPDEPYVGKLGLVVEQNPPTDEFDGPPVEMWWVQWIGNRDWDIEWEKELTVVSG